ncbi:MAG: hypothetical protein EOM85_00240 [Candidatus Moranbacteria bacterium]|nr:hypothetical protein [Candidatus Moranbacteria bacterium]
MNIFHKLLPENLYHSYLIEGSGENIFPVLVDYLLEKNIIEEKDPDLFLREYESIGIDDGQEIKEWHNKMPTKNFGKKVCLLKTNFINREAEQSLLKILEEPGQNTVFFIVIPNASVLLETIKSRTHLVRYEDEYSNEMAKIVARLVSSSVKDRVDIVAEIIKENKNDESSGQLRRYAIVLIQEIEKYFYSKFKNNPCDKNIIFILEELRKNKEYLNYPGASVKMILEYVSLII